MVPPTERPASYPRWRAVAWLLGSAGAIVAGFTASVQQDGATWAGIRGPVCPLGGCLGERHCPGCGLVRSVSATLQGELDAAFAFHPGGIVIAGLLFLTAGLHLDILRRGRETERLRRLRRAGRLTFVAAVLLGWLLRYLTPTI